MAKNYSGGDLSQSDKRKLSGFIREIKKILVERECTNIELYYGFHFISGFFTSKNGQIYYIGSSDTRFDFKIYYRTAKSYKDFKGGQNISLNNILDLKTVRF